MFLFALHGGLCTCVCVGGASSAEEWEGCLEEETSKLSPGGSKHEGTSILTGIELTAVGGTKASTVVELGLSPGTVIGVIIVKERSGESSHMLAGMGASHRQKWVHTHIC